MAQQDESKAGGVPPERVLSIDALRGFDMFWIIGADSLVREILKRGNWSFSPMLTQQLEHVDWEGFRFYDLIFPLFLFLVGCVIPFSLEKLRNQPSSAYWRIIRRTLLLVLLGFMCNGLLRLQFTTTPWWNSMRWAGVLQRIGLCYGIASLISLHTRARGQAVLVAAILLGYWACLALVPVPGGRAGDYSKEGNLAGYLDRTILPGKIMQAYYGFGDNEGLLSTIPAVATTLLGVLCGHLLRSGLVPWKKVVVLLLAGVASVLAGTAWGQFFPIIKNIWTSSFVLVAGGYSMILLALFYLVIDVVKIRFWAWPFVIIGLNAITIFVVPRFVDFDKMSKYFFGGIAGHSGVWGPTIVMSGELLCLWLFLYVLYRQRMFLRV